MNQEPEQHWRGWWIPAEIGKLMMRGKLEPREVILLAMIDGMVHHSGKSCWASNPELASYMGCSTKRIEFMISKLKRMKLLVVVGFDGRRRYIETQYSRILSRSLENEGTVPANNRDRRNRPPEGRPYYLRKKSTKGKPRNYFLIKCCELLRTGVHTKTRNIISWRAQNQTEPFRLLIKDLNGDEERFLDVLEWYVENLDQVKAKRLPMTCSPSEFRKQWNWISERYEELKPKEVKVKITKEAESIYDEVIGLGWPKGSDANLLEFIQRGIDEYRIFRNKIESHSETVKPYSNVAYQMLSYYSARPYQFVVNWFRDLNAMCRGWDKWQGDLWKYQIKCNKESEKFMSIGRGYCKQYYSDAKNFDKLMEAIDG